MQVNLYLPELHPQQDRLNARNAALLVLAFVFVLALIQIALGMRASSIEADVESQRAAVADLQARVNKLRSASTATGSKSLDDTIARLELAIANREKVGRIISGQNVGNAQGFSASMHALARESRDDFALDHFTLTRGGSYVEMHGEARSAQAVPLYLQRLRNDPAFAQARFGLLSVSSEHGGAQTKEFSLGYDNVYAQKPARKK